MQSVLVKFRNLLVARVVLFTACALSTRRLRDRRTGPTAVMHQSGHPARAGSSAAERRPVANSEPMTHSRAARECWMRTEKGSAHENLDKRAELVNKCIDEKMKAAGAYPRPEPEASKNPWDILLRPAARRLAFGVARLQGDRHGERSDAFDEGKKEAKGR